MFCKVLMMNFKINLFFTGHDAPLYCLVASPDGTEIFSGSWDNTVRRWSVQTGQCLQVYRGHTNDVYCVALLPNRDIVSGSSDFSIKIWSRLTGDCLHTLTGHTSLVFGLTVCPNGDVVSASQDRSLRVWRAGNSSSDPYFCRQIIANAHSAAVWCITTVPGADDLITGGGRNDPTVKVWRRANASADYLCFETLAGHTGGVRSVAVMADGRIVSGSEDKNVKIWSLVTKSCVDTLMGHSGSVAGVAVLPYNELVSGSHDKTLKIWM